MQTFELGTALWSTASLGNVTTIIIIWGVHVPYLYVTYATLILVSEVSKAGSVSVSKEVELLAHLRGNLLHTILVCTQAFKIY